jgi:hypothetical protein
MSTTATPAAQGNAKPAAPKAKSTLDAIPCTVKKQFYDVNMQLVAEGNTYYYTPEPDRPFPFPLLQPNDPELAAEATAEYENFRKEKLAQIRAKKERQFSIEALAKGI